MHRSGTSCLAGSLERCGLHLGPVSRANRANARGNHELRAVQLIHNEILSSSGGSWHQPPASINIQPEHTAALKAQAHKLLKHAPCGLKDPRLLLLLDAWEGVVQPQIWIGTFRHPLAVAGSLERRNQMPAETALALWQHYNAELVRRHRANPFPLVEFNLADLDTYLESVSSLAAHLGLTPDLPALKDFIAAELDHEGISEIPAPEQCQELYAYLQAGCWQANPADH